ncbi:LEC14B protein-like isoform X1 [Iris pallida]|uniref:LEC14B protein-like isoform X1 n=1 Tax=Iris pallida TaxID=29817 RepID=A0AAX6GJ58_IRIPA|nr:LEC14B protein-like isoform X1 [Iris pallida]
MRTKTESSYGIQTFSNKYKVGYLCFMSIDTNTDWHIYSVWHFFVLNGMGYNMSKPELDPSLCSGSTDDGASSRQKYHRSFDTDHDIFHLTRLHSEPSRSTVMGMHGGRKLPISTIKMLAGREVNCSGRGRFSSADSSRVLGRYLPVNGPWPVDRMDTRAYVSRFSSDGSLFIAGFQGSHIRIYNVDNGWKVQKDILARSLRWTITDTSLSPDRRFLDIHDGLDFSVHEEGIFSFGIFSVKFSTDGRELVAGTSDDSICLRFGSK